MKKLLMLGTSYVSCEMVRYAKSLGVYTIVTDPNEPTKSKAKQISDEYWMINCGDVDLLEKKCREENVTAIICGISEFCLEICMELCNRLGLPCYCTPEAWHYSRDKVDFKDLCKKIGAPLATDYYIPEKYTDKEIDAVKLPVVVKPIDMSANRGISYCHTKEELINGIKHARSMSKSSKLVVERMLVGEEWYSSYVFSKGEIRFLGLCAMYSEPGEPKNCYTITSTISNHVEQYIQEINPYIEKVLKEVGCKEGYGWVQVMLDQDGHFYIIEMGYRLDGDMMFIPLANLTGYDVVKELVHFACGLKQNELPKNQQHAFKKCGTGMMLWSNKEGVITKMEGMNEIAKIPGIYVETLRQIGDEIHKYEILGNVCFSTNTIDETFELIRKVNDIVHFYNQDGEDVIIKYTNFDYLKKVYQEGLEGK